MDNRLIAKIARQGGAKLLDKAVDTLLSKAPLDGAVKRTSISRKLAGAALLRVATGSVPGALVVGGGLLAKHLHDRRKARSKTTPATSKPRG